MFTGASSLAAAYSMEDDGRVIACDINNDYIETARTFWRQAGVEDKIDVRINPAAQTLQSLIDNGEAGSFDFAFIDADKESYDTYYEKCLVLLRPGGVIAIDNTLWSGSVLDPNAKESSTLALQALNDKIALDTSRVFAVQLNIGDGYTLVSKL